jgi:hypothetical protein
LPKSLALFLESAKKMKVIQKFQFIQEIEIFESLSFSLQFPKIMLMI